jgi:hypothetical protein
MDYSLYNAMLLSENSRKWNQEHVYVTERHTDLTSDNTVLDHWFRDAQNFAPDQMPNSFSLYSHDFNPFTIPSSKWNTNSGVEKTIQDSVPKDRTSSCKQPKLKTK